MKRLLLLAALCVPLLGGCGGSSDCLEFPTERVCGAEAYSWCDSITPLLKLPEGDPAFINANQEHTARAWEKPCAELEAN